MQTAHSDFFLCFTNSLHIMFSCFSCLLEYKYDYHYWLFQLFSRGLLPPKVVVEDIGGTRTDAGMLGYGIYFADLARSLSLVLMSLVTIRTLTVM